jgi:hypothetical protein
MRGWTTYEVCECPIPANGGVVSEDVAVVPPAHGCEAGVVMGSRLVQHQVQILCTGCTPRVPLYHPKPIWAVVIPVPMRAQQLNIEWRALRLVQWCNRRHCSGCKKIAYAVSRALVSGLHAVCKCVQPRAHPPAGRPAAMPAPERRLLRPSVAQGQAHSQAFPIANPFAADHGNHITSCEGLVGEVEAVSERLHRCGAQAVDPLSWHDR